MLHTRAEITKRTIADVRKKLEDEVRISFDEIKLALIFLEIMFIFVLSIVELYLYSPQSICGSESEN